MCPLFLSGFNEIYVFSTEFQNNPQMPNFMKSRPVGAELFHAYKQTDMTKPKVGFRNFAKASNNKEFSRICDWPSEIWSVMFSDSE